MFGLSFRGYIEMNPLFGIFRNNPKIKSKINDLTKTITKKFTEKNTGL